MKIISISKLTELYEKISKKNRKEPNFKKGFFNYLNLSVHYSRDERDFDLNNYELLKSLVTLFTCVLTIICDDFDSFRYCAQV